MNLDKAYESWGQMSDNRELYFKTKTLFRKIWWLIPTNKPCSYYTLDVLGRALVQANGAPADKAKAASVMVHVLCWANQAHPDDNPKPDFSFQDIIDYTGCDRGQVPVTSQANEKRDGGQERDGGQVPVTGQVNENERDRNLSPVTLAKRDGGEAAKKAKKAVVQLDPDTLKPIKVWKSAFAPESELGIRNVYRAIERHGLAGGYYWCRPGDEEEFKPIDKRANNGRERDRGQVPVTGQVNEKERVTGDRFLSPNKSAQTVVTGTCPLSHATQDELIAELRRREWKGTLRITTIIEL